MMKRNLKVTKSLNRNFDLRLWKKSGLNFLGQTVVEYTLLIGIIIAVVIVLSPMVKRGTQGMVKVVADELGYQKNAEQQGEGGLIGTNITSTFDRQQRRDEWRSGSTHSQQMSYNETTQTDTKAKSSLGVR